MNNKKVVILWEEIGYGTELLYMDPILAGFLKEFPNTTLLNLKTNSSVKETGHPILMIAQQRKLFGPIITFISVMYHLCKSSPKLIVLTEFNQMTLYGIFYRFFNKYVRLLLLIENDPRFLVFFYNKNRKNKFFTVFRKWIVSRVDLILTNNSKGQRYLTVDLKTAPEKILSGPYLTSSIKQKSDLEPKILQPGENLRLLGVGQMIERKGYHFLLQTLFELPNEILSRVQLTLVGEGIQRSFLETLTHRYKLNKNVIFIGNCPYNKLFQYYQDAHLFIIPTLGDFRSLVNFEALSSGLPIIGSVFDGASTEAIEENINGFIVDPRDIKNFGNKITLFLKEPYLVEKFSRASFRKSMDFTVEKAVNNLINACYLCCNENRTKT